MTRRWLVTGGAGFIGSNFVRWALGAHPDLRVITLDKLTYAGNRENLSGLPGADRHHFVQGDITDPAVVEPLAAQAQAIIHFAAETHVDRSIVNAEDFMRTNVLGTHVLLEAFRRHPGRLFMQVSTDEVYGSIPQGAWTESQPLRPNSPYAASKASADLLAQAYATTYRLPVIVTRCSNNYGPYQYPEKLIPLAVTNALQRQPIPIYGDGLNVRDWVHVEDHCRALGTILARGAPGESYHIGAGEERPNLEVVRAILRLLDRPESLLQPVADRPGHDRRYALDTSRIRALGWTPGRTFEHGLQETIAWYRDHPHWWEPLKRRAPSHWLSPERTTC